MNNNFTFLFIIQDFLLKLIKMGYMSHLDNVLKIPDAIIEIYKAPLEN